MFTNRLLCLGASAGALSLRGSGCRNLALPGVYEQASTLFPANYPTSLLLNLTHTTELKHLVSLGHEFQNRGQTLVKWGESGLNNLSNYKKTFEVASGISGASPLVQQRMNDFGISGALAVSSLHVANETLKNTKDSIYSSSISVLAGVSLPNVAAQDLVQTMILAAPAEKKDVVSELANSRLERLFSDEQLDTLLGKFRADLPGRRRGAWDAFFSPGEDKLAQAAHTMRDVINEIVAKLGSNHHVEACSWYDSKKDKPTRADRLRLLLYGPESKPEAETGLVNAQVKEFSDLIDSIIKVAHGSHSLRKDQVKLGMRQIEELIYQILCRLEA